MSDSVKSQNPTAALYAYHLSHAADGLALLAERAVHAPALRNQLKHLNFFAKRIRSTLPTDGAEIGPRWWQRYGQFFAMVEDLQHPDFDDDFDALWVGLLDPC